MRPSAPPGRHPLSGFRTFERWKRERIEEKRIDIALDALSLAYEVKSVFDSIRSPLTRPHEWADMPEAHDDNEDERRRRGPFYAIFKRIIDHKDFFERAWKLQPRFMALFWPQTADIFLQMHQARRWIEVGAEILARRRDGAARNADMYDQLEADVWNGSPEERERIGPRLTEFTSRIEELCRPIVDRVPRA